MGSLYIRDPATAERATRVADRLGITKTEAVRRGLTMLEETAAAPVPVSDAYRRLRAWQAAHPLGEPTGLEADKAFYDSLNDEDDDDLR